LSAREREVAALLVAGHSYKKIAEFLFVSPGTIKTHVLNIYSKTDTRNKLELLHKARRPSPG
jgi:DNA-binding CsgD family transcriptional regulator